MDSGWCPGGVVVITCRVTVPIIRGVATRELLELISVARVGFQGIQNTPELTKEFLPKSRERSRLF